jgi:hypothetical protein
MTDRTPQSIASVYMKLLILLKDVKSLASHFSSFRKSEMVIIWWSYNVLHVCSMQIMQKRQELDNVETFRRFLRQNGLEQCPQWQLRHLQWHAYLQLCICLQTATQHAQHVCSVCLRRKLKPMSSLYSWHPLNLFPAWQDYVTWEALQLVF